MPVLIAENNPKRGVLFLLCTGLIHASDIFQPLIYGKKINGYIKKVREDGKIDVALRQPGQNSINELAQRIMSRLEQSDGFLALHDKSTPEEIKQIFAESKKNFKSALGQLYKRDLINIEEKGIRLQTEPKKS